ncbi:exodeoxyribonuclease VII small subunit [Synechocystis sp. PCC 7509]|uniref:exodeoxyribonuclease VII small subunit n=1 Tax=Synechocystis sp. PCC 7509 TaxID=927677 RepID=UPI0002ACB7D1|nr:exodeoxyribonuclease VII small subunit [Synechocystis sp. PCC 7509]
MTDSPRAKKKANWNYEATVAKVEKIINQLESGELELAEVFTEFTTAVEYLRECEAFLNQKQQQMTLLVETLTEQTDSF